MPDPARSRANAHLLLAILLGAMVGGGSTGIAAVLVPSPATPTNGGPLPIVFLASPMFGGTFVAVDVAEAQPSRPLDDFSALAFRDTVPLGELAPLADRATSGNLSFSDRDGGGRLTAGDRFVVTLLASGSYELRVFYRGVRVATMAWSV